MANKLFKFWLENRCDGEFELSEVEIRHRFRAFIASKGRDWADYYNSEQVTLSFIADKEGLNSVFEPNDLEAIRLIIKPDYRAYVGEKDFEPLPGGELTNEDLARLT